MGVAGAGFATMIGQIVALACCCPLLSAQKKARERADALLPAVYATKPLMGEILRIGIPSFIRSGMKQRGRHYAQHYRRRALRRRGHRRVSVVTRILFLVNAALHSAYGQGYHPISGYNYGAGRF